MTGDAAEPPAAPGLPGLGPAGTTSTARVYNYLLGGKDNNAADRQAAEQLLRALPDAGLVAKANRAFMAAAVRQAAANGVTQFLDIGPGFPATPSVHESARSAAPGARVAYVDHDSEVVARTRELLAGDDLVTAFSGDAGDIEAILANPQLSSLIDLAEPVRACPVRRERAAFRGAGRGGCHRGRGQGANCGARAATWCQSSRPVNNEQNEPAHGLIQAAYSSGNLLAGCARRPSRRILGDFEIAAPWPGPGAHPLAQRPALPDQGSS